MNINDFRYIREGVVVRPAAEDELRLIEERHIKVNDRQQSVLLMFHGFGSTPAVFRHMVNKITGYDSIICPLWPGHGADVFAMESATAEDWFQAALEVTEEALSTYKQVDVLGLSLGGLLATYVATQCPSINHLFLLAPALDIKPALYPSLKLSQWMQKLGFRYIRNRAGNIHHQTEPELAYRLMPIRSLEVILNMIEGYFFQHSDCPTDVFLGRYDKVVNSKRIARRYFGRQNVKIHWLEQSAHVLPVDRDMQEIIDVINESACCSDHSSRK